MTNGEVELRETWNTDDTNQDRNIQNSDEEKNGLHMFLILPKSLYNLCIF